MEGFGLRVPDLGAGKESSGLKPERQARNTRTETLLQGPFQSLQSILRNDISNLASLPLSVSLSLSLCLSVHLHTHIYIYTYVHIYLHYTQDC